VHAAGGVLAVVLVTVGLLWLLAPHDDTSTPTTPVTGAATTTTAPGAATTTLPTATTPTSNPG
jgi:hypothetical protein